MCAVCFGGFVRVLFASYGITNWGKWMLYYSVDSCKWLLCWFFDFLASSSFSASSLYLVDESLVVVLVLILHAPILLISLLIIVVPERDEFLSLSWINPNTPQELMRSLRLSCWVYLFDRIPVIVSYPDLLSYWCHDGKRIVPVAVLVWDSLSSPWGAALEWKVSVMDP